VGELVLGELMANCSKSPVEGYVNVNSREEQEEWIKI
jgi:hypothetical protein